MVHRVDSSLGWHRGPAENWKKRKIEVKESMIKLKAKSFNILCYNLLFPPVKVLFSLAGATDLFQVTAPEDG